MIEIPRPCEDHDEPDWFDCPECWALMELERLGYDTKYWGR